MTDKEIQEEINTRFRLFDKEPIDKPFVAKKVNARRVTVSL